MSGHGDVFQTRVELVTTLRRDIYIDPEQIPFVSSMDRPLNAYVLDAFTHHQNRLLIEENRLRPSEIFEAFKTVSHTLGVIAEAIRRRSAGIPGRLPVSDLVSSVASQYTAVFHEHLSRYQ